MQLYYRREEITCLCVNVCIVQRIKRGCESCLHAYWFQSSFPTQIAPSQIDRDISVRCPARSSNTHHPFMGTNTASNHRRSPHHLASLLSCRCLMPVQKAHYVRTTYVHSVHPANRHQRGRHVPRGPRHTPPACGSWTNAASSHGPGERCNEIAGRIFERPRGEVSRSWEVRSNSGVAKTQPAQKHQETYRMTTDWRWVTCTSMYVQHSPFFISCLFWSPFFQHLDHASPFYAHAEASACFCTILRPGLSESLHCRGATTSLP